MSHETIRFWWNRIGPIFAAEIRKKRTDRIRVFSGGRRQLDKVFVKINGECPYLWRAVDHEGWVLEAFVSKEGLAAARAKGRLLGRPKGALGKSKLDGKEEEIRILLQKQVSKASIAKIVGVSRTALHHFINSRKLDPKASQPAVTNSSSLKDIFAAIWSVPLSAQGHVDQPVQSGLVRRGFLYLVAVMDWASRHVLAWRLSNTLDAGFCVEALDEVLTRHGQPEIFNTDQGSQFTGYAFTSRGGRCPYLDAPQRPLQGQYIH